MAETKTEAIRERLEAAGLTGPMRVRVGYEGARHVPIIDHGRGLDGEEVVARTYEADDERHEHAWPRAHFIAHASADLACLLDENERLRRDHERPKELTAESRLWRDLDQAARDNDQLHSALAAAQEREKGLREALEKLLKRITEPNGVVKYRTDARGHDQDARIIRAAWAALAREDRA